MARFFYSNYDEDTSVLLDNETETDPDEYDEYTADYWDDIERQNRQDCN
jgi:hypothetical protein